jgi:hypothetical protein
MPTNIKINSQLIELYIDHTDVTRYEDILLKVVKEGMKGAKLEKFLHPNEKQYFFSAKFQTEDKIGFGQVIIAPTVVAVNINYETGVNFSDSYKNLVDSIEIVKKLDELLINKCFLRMEVGASFEFESLEKLKSESKDTYYGYLLDKGFETIEYAVTKSMDSSFKLEVQISNTTNSIFNFKNKFEQELFYKLNFKIAISSLPKYMDDEPLGKDDYLVMKEKIESYLKISARTLFLGDF